MGNYLNSTYWHINFFFAVGSCLWSLCCPPGAIMTSRPELLLRPFWVWSSTAANICVDICGSCYHQRPCKYLGDGSSPEAVLMSEGQAAVGGQTYLSGPSCHNVPW